MARWCKPALLRSYPKYCKFLDKLLSYWILCHRSAFGQRERLLTGQSGESTASSSTRPVHRDVGVHIHIVVSHEKLHQDPSHNQYLPFDLNDRFFLWPPL